MVMVQSRALEHIKKIESIPPQPIAFQICVMDSLVGHHPSLLEVFASNVGGHIQAFVMLVPTCVFVVARRVIW